MSWCVIFMFSQRLFMFNPSRILAFSSKEELSLSGSIHLSDLFKICSMYGWFALDPEITSHSSTPCKDYTALIHTQPLSCHASKVFFLFYITAGHLDITWAAF